MSNYQSLSIEANVNSTPGFSGSPSSGVQRYTVPSPGSAPDTSFGQHSRAQDHSRHQTVTTADLGTENGIEAISPTGRPLAPSEVTPDTLVTVGGLQMKASQAERLGLLTKGADGYGLAPAGTQANATKAPAKTEPTDADKAEAAPPLPDAASRALQSLAGGGQDVVGASLELLETGELSTGAAERLARRLGIEPHQVVDRVEAVVEGFREVAAGLLGGADSLELAHEHFKADFDKAIKAHSLRGDVSGYKALAAKVLDHRIDSADAIQSPDPTLKIRSAHGKHFVSGKGLPGEVELKSAIRLGIISLA
ncbi:hypothetical protein [Nevskia ramosa]|uniref:hypothetical protein n=1 Tax=Nevskia ramosa TaxID=64002 RepID=UPI002352F11C|nr:hypothetical protein [Nevskia ramosa]